MPEVCVDIEVPKVMITDDQRKYLRGWGEDFITRARLRAKLNNLRASRKRLSAIENLLVLGLRFKGPLGPARSTSLALPQQYQCSSGLFVNIAEAVAWPLQ